MNPPTSAPALGLREQNKLDKRKRIREAARELFSNRGYDAATMRQIAERADVGLGTLFTYAEDKRDLVFLIVNDELSTILEEALRIRPTGECFLEELMAIYKPHYRYFSKNPELSRILLRELVFYSAGKQAARFQQIRLGLLGAVEDVVLCAQQKGTIIRTESPATIARYLFFLSSGAIRLWIASPHPKPGPGLTELRKVFELFVTGLQPQANAGLAAEPRRAAQ